MDLPLAKARLRLSPVVSPLPHHISERIKTTAESWKRGVRKCERNSPAATQLSAEGGEGSAPDAGAEILLQPQVQTMVNQAASLLPMESCCGAEIHLLSMKNPTAEQLNVSLKKIPLEGTPLRRRLMAEAGSRKKSQHEGRFYGRTCYLMEESHWSSPSLKDCGKDSHWSRS